MNGDSVKPARRGGAALRIPGRAHKVEAPVCSGFYMRILYSHRVQSRDGQGVHIEAMVQALRQAGHEVLVVGPRFYDQAEFGGESRAVALIRRLLPGVLQEVAELAYNLPAYLRLAKAYAAFRPDFIYERCNLFFLAGTMLAWRRGCVRLLEVNSPLADERAAHGGLRLVRLARWLEHLTWRKASAVLPVTDVLAGHVERAGVPRARICVIPNGVWLESFPPRSGTHGDARIELGFVGFVRAWHGLDAVIDGMAQFHRGRLGLTVVGDGPACPALREQARALGLEDNVVMAGVVPPAQVAALVSRFDIALQPSVTPYASPLKIFDYMAAGCAIVAPDAPNIREILDDGETALLFDTAAPGAMWAAVSRLVEDAALRRQLGEAARAAVVARDFTWPGNARRVIEKVSVLF
jgi:glycosyltransferase involved in cell wall biosynthesis